MSVAADVLPAVAMKSAAAGALSLAMGTAPIGVLLVARRMSLMGDGLSHALLPGVAISFLLTHGHNPAALVAGALIAALIVAAASTLFTREGRLPEDASFAVFYLSALALGVVIIGREATADQVHELLFGDIGALDRGGLYLAAGAASATLISFALFLRGFVAEGADPIFLRASGGRAWALRLLLMSLVALNLVAGFRAFGALMTVGLMMIPAVAARFWARGFVGQTTAAAILCALASASGLLIAARLQAEPGAVMTLSAAALFAVSAIFGPRQGLIATLPGRGHLEG